MARILGKIVTTALWCLGCTLFTVSVAWAQSQRVMVLDTEGAAVPDAVVELVALFDGSRTSSPLVTEVDQVEKEFVPLVTVIPVGSQVNFPNSDDILHHVYSFSPAKTFDIPLYGSESNMVFSQVFDNAGVVEIGCNIHDWMLAYIYVTAAGHAATTDETGVAGFADVSPGAYQLRVWHPRLTSSQPVELDLQVTAGVNQDVSVSLELGRDRRLRRAPSTTRNRYR